MPLDQRFRKHLRSLAAEKAKFKQGVGKQYFDHTVTEEDRANASGGYCTGACLTWLRISLGKEPVPLSHKDSNLVSMMVKTQTRWDGLSEQGEEIFEDFKQHKAAEWFHYAVREQMLELERWLNGLGYDVAFKIVPLPERSKLKAVRRANVKLDADVEAEVKLRIKRALATVPAANQATILRVKAELPGELKSLGAAPEGEYKQRAWRAIEPRLLGNDRSSNTLVPVIASKGVPTGSLKGFICDALAQPSFLVGRGLLVTFYEGGEEIYTKSGDRIGHTIAVLKCADGRFLLFDPNIGIYTLEGIRKLLAALIILLADGYSKRHVVQGEDWIIFAKTERIIPELPDGRSALLNQAHVDYDAAVAMLSTYLLDQSKEAYITAREYALACDKASEFLKRSAAMLEEGKSLNYGTLQSKEFEVRGERFRKDWDAAGKEKDRLRIETLNHCRNIRSCLNAVETDLDEKKVRDFAGSFGNISKTGLGELYTYLEGTKL